MQMDRLEAGTLESADPNPETLLDRAQARYQTTALVAVKNRMQDVPSPETLLDPQAQAVHCRQKTTPVLRIRRICGGVISDDNLSLMYYFLLLAKVFLGREIWDGKNLHKLPIYLHTITQFLGGNSNFSTTCKFFLDMAC
jgi:hypothetical protein